jgi:hypothetical protein
VGFLAVFLGRVGVFLAAGVQGKRVVNAGVPVQGWAYIEAGEGVMVGDGSWEGSFGRWILLA